MGSALRRWWVPVAIVAVLIGCLRLYQVQRDQRSQVFDGTEGAGGSDQVVITVTARGVDPAKDQMQLQVDVDPDATLTDDDGRLLAPLTVHASELSVRVIEFAVRHAAPGSPPFGLLLDFAAFLPAEIVVTVSLVACAWRYVHPPREIG